MAAVNIEYNGNGKPSNLSSLQNENDIHLYSAVGRTQPNQNGRHHQPLSEQQLKAKEKRERKEVRASKPFCFSKLLVHKPWLVIIIGAGVLLLALALIIGLGAFELKDSGNRAYLVWSTEIVKQHDMNTVAQQQIRASLFSGSSTPHSSEFNPFITFFIYEAYDGNILTSMNLQAIKSFEDTLTANADFQKFCVINPTNSADICDETSYEPTFLSNRYTGVDLTSQSAIDAKSAQIANNNSEKILLDKSFSSSNLQSKYGRSIITFAGPLEAYSDVFADRVNQYADFSSFLRNIEGIVKSHRTSSLNILISNRELSNDELNKVAQNDIFLGALSFFIVYAYVAFHLRSLVLSSYGMFQTLLAFPLAYFIFYFIFQIKFYSTIHNLSIFIILGIAADDFFVFNDAWRQTSKLSFTKGDFDKRMALTYRRASKAMFVTSFTTASAFLATGFSDIMPISSFGYFASILIVSNYILVITLFPSVLMVWEYSCAKFCIYEKCCKKCSKSEEKEKEKENESEIENLGCIQRFCFTKFNKLIRKGAIFFLAGLTAWMCVAAYFASQMQPLSDQEQWLPDENPLQRSFDITANQFNPVKSEDLITVTLFWGVDGLDKSKVQRWNEFYAGDIIWDDNFDLSTTQAQQLFLTFCSDLKKLEGPVLNASASGGGEVTCFMEGFRDWLLSNGHSFPVPTSSDFMTRLQEFTQDTSSLDYRSISAYGFVNGQLRYASIDVVTVVEFRSPASEKDPAIDYWNNYVATLSSNAANDPNTAGLSKGKMSGGQGFAWAESEKAFVSNAVRGIIISGVLAFLVLVLSTFNVIVASYAMIGIVGIIISVVALMSFQNWEFGVAESIAVVILIGFSVDYVVHLANHYVQSFYSKRHQRIQEAYGQIGISIIGGAITTIGSGLVLFGAKLTLFNKFAILITSTILFSLIFSLFYFGSLAHLCGPQGSFGSLKVIFCCNKCKRKKEPLEQKSSSNQVPTASAKEKSNSIVVMPQLESVEDK